MPSNEHHVVCGGAVRGRSVQLLELNLRGPDPNVNLEIGNISKKLIANIPARFIDLLEIASYIYSADQAVPRGRDGVLDHGRRWRRVMRFRIPVRCPDFWNERSLNTALGSTLSFLSDDDYEFKFTAQRHASAIDEYLTFEDADPRTPDFEEVMLFSGGIDSLAGAVVETVANKRRVALVSHRSNPKIDSKQKQLVDELKQQSKANPLHVPVWVNKRQSLSHDHTQRTRSFLFACLAFVVARLQKLNRIRFYENGILSMNLPISEQVVGARATRSTHPKVLRDFGVFFSSIAGSAFEVENPFLWLTKREVVEVIGDHGCQHLIRLSSSCVHTIEQSRQHPHCGCCSQCLSRRFATLASRYARDDPAENYRVDLLTGPREQPLDRVLAESFIRTALEMKRMEEIEVAQRFGEVSRIVRYVRGISSDQCISRIHALHKRHGEDVERVLNDAIKTHSGEIVARTLPRTCTIVLALPQKVDNTAGPDTLVAADSETRDAGTTSPAERSFSRVGDHWAITFGRKVIHIRALVGLEYLNYLVHNPGTRVSALRLISAKNGPVVPLTDMNGDSLLDRKAIEAYRNRAESLRSEINAARQQNNLGMIENLVSELQMIEDQLKAGIGRGGRLRPGKSAAENVRKRVSKAVAGAIDAIAKEDPALGSHFRERVGRGNFLDYRGDGVEWS